MGLGILKDKYLGEDVPGTSLFEELQFHGHNVNADGAHLKRTKEGIVLIPQPSNSPNDPLNWPFWRKCMLMLTITYGAGVVGAFGPIIGAGLVQVAQNLDTSVAQLSKITGDLVLSIGLILILTAPASVVWGRRPVFLIGNALLLASAIWSACAKDLGSLTASRVIGGIGMAPIECLVEATVADIFFVHERGRWIAVWSFALLGGICGVSIVNGYLIQDVSWRVCFIVEAALCGVLLVMTILFVPETAYVRPEIDTLVVGGAVSTVPELSRDSREGSSAKLPDEVSEKPRASDEQVERTDAEKNVHSSEKPEGFLESMKPYAGHRFTDESFWKIACRPFTLCCSPLIMWGALVFGTTNAWLVALSVSVSLLFSEPSYGYGFGAGTVGLIAGVGPFIGALLGNLLAGPLSDWTTKWMSRRNGGIYEPEFRLLIMVPFFISSTMGWFGWAISAHLQQLWIGPEIFFSLINFGQAIASIAAISYVVDAHSGYAPESFATINALKNIFAFAVTYFVTPWLENQGILKTFFTIGGLNIFVCAATIPMYFYGKRARSWVHRTPWMLA